MDKFLSNSTIEHLLSFANVVGIGYGFKEVNGQSTDSEAIMVMNPITPVLELLHINF